MVDAIATKPIGKSPLRILVATGEIDRDPITRTFDSLLINHREVSGETAIDHVATGREAVSLAQAFDYDIVFLDASLEDLDAYQVACELRGLESSFIRLRHVPIIAVIASSSPLEKSKCIAAGMNDYLIKPIDLETVQGMLNTWTATLPDHPVTKSSRRRDAV
jgi:CheY-like chemotaxis protein